MKKWTFMYDRPESLLAIVIALANVIIGLAVIPSLHDLDRLVLFQQLHAISHSGLVWAAIHVGLGAYAFYARLIAQKTHILIAYTAIIVFWLWISLGWAGLPYIPPHGLLTLLLNTSGSVVVFLFARGRD